MDRPNPTPIPVDADGTRHCPYRDEILAIRRWSKIGWLLITLALTGLGGGIVYSASIVSAASARDTSVSLRISEHTRGIERNERDISEVRNASDSSRIQIAEMQGRLLSELQAIKASITEMQGRIDRRGR